MFNNERIFKYLKNTDVVANVYNHMGTVEFENGVVLDNPVACDIGDHDGKHGINVDFYISIDELIGTVDIVAVDGSLLDWFDVPGQITAGMIDIVIHVMRLVNDYWSCENTSRYEFLHKLPPVVCDMALANDVGEIFDKWVDCFRYDYNGADGAEIGWFYNTKHSGAMKSAVERFYDNRDYYWDNTSIRALYKTAVEMGVVL